MVTFLFFFHVFVANHSYLNGPVAPTLDRFLDLFWSRAMSLLGADAAARLATFKQALSDRLYPDMTARLSAFLHTAQLPTEAYVALADVFRDALCRAEADAFAVQRQRNVGVKPARRKPGTFTQVCLLFCFSCFVCFSCNVLKAAGCLQKPMLVIEDLIAKSVITRSEDVATGRSMLHLTASPSDVRPLFKILARAVMEPNAKITSNNIANLHRGLKQNRWFLSKSYDCLVQLPVVGAAAAEDEAVVQAAGGAIEAEDQADVQAAGGAIEAEDQADVQAAGGAASAEDEAGVQVDEEARSDEYGVQVEIEHLGVDDTFTRNVIREFKNLIRTNQLTPLTDAATGVKYLVLTEFRTPDALYLHLAKQANNETWNVSLEEQRKACLIVCGMGWMHDTSKDYRLVFEQ